MENVIEDIQKLIQLYSTAAIDSIEKIPQSGSDRIYFNLDLAKNNLILGYDHLGNQLVNVGKTESVSFLLNI